MIVAHYDDGATVSVRIFGPDGSEVGTSITLAENQPGIYSAAYPALANGTYFVVPTPRMARLTKVTFVIQDGEPLTIRTLYKEINRRIEAAERIVGHSDTGLSVIADKADAVLVASTDLTKPGTEVAPGPPDPVTPPEDIVITSSDGDVGVLTFDSGDVTFDVTGAAKYNGTYMVSQALLEAGAPINLVEPTATLNGASYEFDMGFWIAPGTDQPEFANRVLRGGQPVGVNVLSYDADVFDAQRTLQFEVTARNVEAATVNTLEFQTGLQFTQNGLVVTAKSFVRAASPLVITPRQSFVGLVSHKMDPASGSNLMLVGSAADAIKPFQMRRNGFSDNFNVDDGGTLKRVFGQNQFGFVGTDTVLLTGDNQNLAPGDLLQMTAMFVATAGGPIQMWTSSGGNFVAGQNEETLSGTSIDLSGLAFEYPHVQYNGTLYRGAAWLTDAAMPDFTSDDFRDSIVNPDGSLAPPAFAQLIFGGPGSGLLFDSYGTAADANAITFEGDLNADGNMTLRPGGSFADE